MGKEVENIKGFIFTKSSPDFRKMYLPPIRPSMPTPKEEFDVLMNRMKLTFEDVCVENEVFKKSVEFKDSEILRLNKECDTYRSIVKSKQEFLNSITPTQVYHNKKRGNTTVKFLDGSSVTVKKMKGDKDCLETAIVWAIFKKMYPNGLMKHLVKNTIETGEK